MTIVTLMLVMNPAALAAIWLGFDDEIEERRALSHLAIVAIPTCALLIITVLAGEPVLNALDISDSTFRIAAGALVIFGALQAFLGFGIRHDAATRAWMIAALLVWLLSPPVVASAVAIRINEGIAVGLATAIGFTVVSVLLGYGWKMLASDRYPVILGLIRRVLAAGAVIGGVDLIRQGVLSI